MPAIHFSTFRIRYDECDHYGHLFHANYIRLMQDAAFNASSSIGFDLSRYNQLGKLWLVRYIEIEFLRPIRYGDTITIKTWVADLRHSSSRRNYEFTRAGQNELMARACTDWVFVDNITSQPAPVPDQIKRAFFPEGMPDSFPPRLSFPRMPGKPLHVYCHHHKVNWKDIDSLGMVNNPCYLDYATECGIQAIAHFGWSWERMAKQGFAIFIRKAQIRHIKPAWYGDDLAIYTWVSNVKRSTATRHYEITRSVDNTLIAQVHTLGVWINLESGMPVRIPEEMLQDFSDNFVSEHANEDKTNRRKE